MSVRTTPNCPTEANAVVAPFSLLNGQSATQIGTILASATSNCTVFAVPIVGMSYSPDASQIVLARIPDPNYVGWDLEIYNTSGGLVRKLTSNGGGPTPVANWNPSWSPDGGRIAFASNASGVFQIYTIDPGGTNLTQVTTSGGDWPTWSPDSSKIAFQSTRGGNSEIYSVLSTGFLSFPLQNETAYSAKIVSVFDHSSDWQYCSDNIVTAYDGETGKLEYGTDSQPTSPICYQTQLINLAFGFAQDKNKTPFYVNGQYVGVKGDGGKKYLQYDGHPGFDFVTTDQNKSGEIPVLAAAEGTVVCSNVPVPAQCSTKSTADPCIEGPGEIKIRHPNGYFSIYLHLSSSSVTANEHVSAQQQIGMSGDTGVCGNPHLHFEVRKSTCGNHAACRCDLAQTVNVKNCIPVDPYGWSGVGEDPYMHGKNKVPNVELWK